MQERHLQREKYFKEQEFTVKNYVIPFIEKSMRIDKNISVLEIGCGEGGNLKSFLDIGCKKVIGVDLALGKIKNANLFYQDHPNKQNIKFIHADIYDIFDIGQFDLIMMRDVLEHIHDQNKFMGFVKRFMKPTGKFFLGFPPWQNPFGGHQQICESKILSKMPYFHILPSPVYRLILKMFGEKDDKIRGLLEVKETGITIERFERILKRNTYHKDNRVFYFINPNYDIKFNLKPKEQTKLISSIPYFRNFFITTNYYLISAGKGSSGVME